MDAILLSAILAEAQGALEGARVQRVQSDGPEGVVLALQGRTGPLHLSMGWEAWGPRWYLGRAPAPAGGDTMFAAALAANLRGGRVSGVVRPGMERAVCLEVAWRRGQTARRLALWAFLWPAGRNVVLVDAEAGRVIAAARPGPWGPGMRFAVPTGRGDASLWAARVEGVEAERSRLPTEEPGPRLEAAVTRAFPTLGPLLAREIAFRAARGGGAEGRGGVSAAFGDVLEAVHAGCYAPRIILGADGNPQAAMAVRLAHLPEERQRSFPTANAAAEAFYAARRIAAEADETRAWARRLLRQARDRVTRRMDKLAVELALHRQATAQRQMGEILVAHQRAVPRGAAEAVLPDPYGPPGATRTIPLDPALSAAGNAERYFRRARRGARGEALTAERLAASRRELDRIGDLEKVLEDAASPEALDALAAAVRRLGRVPGPRFRVPGPQVEVKPRPSGRSSARGGRPAAEGRGRDRGDAVARLARRFLSSDGFPILVGRNNAANDELTLHVARPDDLWLHVEGHGGSHVVIRRGDRPEVPRQTLLEAAQLAAYYSQARGQRKVPVHYTLRKYVRKPKGAKPGLVTITQEKAILATPDPALVRRLAAAAGEGET